MTPVLILAAVLVVFLAGYLVAAMLKPEWFQ